MQRCPATSPRSRRYHPSPRPVVDTFLRASRAEIAIASGPMDPLTAAVAEDLLDGLPLVPAMAGSIPEMKNLRDRCLVAGIPAIVGCPPGAGKG